MDAIITATLFDDNGDAFEQSFEVERRFSVKGKEYLALVPTDNDSDVYLFDFIEHDGKISLLEIEDDAVYEQVADTYEAMMEA